MKEGSMKQKGFVLVSVLIITTITAMLAFSQLGENRLEERMAGNQRKVISARLAAEKGIFNAFDVIALGGTTEEMGNNLNTVISADTYAFDPDSNILVLVSTGEVDGATAHLKAVIKGAEGDAVIACDSVNVWGSGNIEGDVSVKGGIGNVTYNNRDSIQGKISEYTGVCDPLDITAEIADMATQVIDTPSDFATNVDTNFDGVNAAGDVFPQALTVLEEEKQVYVFHDFNIKNNNVLITGDITFYIRGDLTTKNTIFTLANNSSLTIFIEGNMDIETGSDIFADQSVSTNGKTPLMVYSSSRGSDISNAAHADTAVHLSGNASIYMNLYAPLGTVAYNSNADIMGAIRADVVDLGGNGIHYDQGLGKSASYCAIYYYYPKDNIDPLDIVDAAAYRDYCGASAEPLFCGYNQRSYNDQYSEYRGAAAEAAEAVDLAAAAADTAVDLAAAEATRIGTLSAGEATIATAAVAAAVAQTTRCTVFAATAETRWAATAAAAATVAATRATALSNAEAANATDAEKAVAAAIANAAAVAAAEAVAAVDVAAIAAAKAVDVAATAATNAAVLAAAGAIEVTATTDATAKAALVKAIADAATAEAAAVAARLKVQTAADAKAKSDKILAVAADAGDANDEIDRLQAIVLEENSGNSSSNGNS
jgi:hypothetical protein